MAADTALVEANDGRIALSDPEHVWLLRKGVFAGRRGRRSAVYDARMSTERDRTYWDPDKALLVIAARVALGNGRSVRRRLRNPDEVAALAIMARQLWRGGTFVERVDNRTFRLLPR